MPKKNKPANAVKTRARLAGKRATKAVAVKKVARTKRAAQSEMPRKRFDAMKWCGILPELAGDSLTIQRQMRDEW